MEGFAGAEGHAGGVGPLGLFVAEVGVYLVEAGLAVARFKGLPWYSGPVEEGLGGAVEFGGPVPVAGVGGQACQAEGGVGDVDTMSGAAAYGDLETDITALHQPRSVLLRGQPVSP